MLSRVLANESGSRIFSYINLNGFLSPLSRKNLFKLQDKIVVSSMEKYPTAPGESDVICSTMGWLKAASQSLEYGKNYEGDWNGELFVKQVSQKWIEIHSSNVTSVAVAGEDNSGI